MWDYSLEPWSLRISFLLIKIPSKANRINKPVTRLLTQDRTDKEEGEEKEEMKDEENMEGEEMNDEEKKKVEVEEMEQDSSLTHSSGIWD